MARREEGEYREYATDEQRSQPGMHRRPNANELLRPDTRQPGSEVARAAVVIEQPQKPDMPAPGRTIPEMPPPDPIDKPPPDIKPVPPPDIPPPAPPVIEPPTWPERA
jgi:hypothetical protein